MTSLRVLVFLFGLGEMALWAADGRPNVIVFVADDMGWNDVGYQSTDLQGMSPHIDDLAAKVRQIGWLVWLGIPLRCLAFSPCQSRNLISNSPDS